MTSMVAVQETVRAVETRANQLVAQFDPIRALLIVLSLPFIVVGWLARLVYRVVLVVGAWVFSAVEAGWKRGAPRPDGRSG